MLLAVIITIVVVALVVGAVRRSRRAKRQDRTASARWLEYAAAQADARGGEREHSSGYSDTPHSHRSAGGGGGGGS